jgi:hypothetical protein
MRANDEFGKLHAAVSGTRRSAYVAMREGMLVTFSALGSIAECRAERGARIEGIARRVSCTA